MEFGILTLIPPIVIIVFALVTKKTFEALLLGAIIAFIMTDGKGFLSTTVYTLAEVLGENTWMIMVFGVLGGFSILLEKSKGPMGFGKFLRKFANSEKKTLMIGWVLGILIFMDDYLNMLVVSSALKDTCDKHKTPREMLAYVMDSTGAPICILLPISTWAVYFATLGLAEDGMSVYGTEMEFYIQAIPYIFYGYTALLVVPLVILRIIPIFGPMKKAYQRVAETGKVYSDASAKYNLNIEEFDKRVAEQEENGEKLEGNLWNFVIPLGLVIIVTIITEDLLIGLAIAVIVQLVMYLPQKLLTFTGYCESLVEGFASMAYMMFITVGALTVTKAMDAIGMPDYVISLVLPYMNVHVFYAIAFVVVACLSFVTGSCWGVPAVTIPILIPLSIAGGADPLITFACIVSAAGFGSHACFYSDATVLTSKVSGIDNMEHALTQIPFALISAIIAIVSYLVIGFVM